MTTLAEPSRIDVVRIIARLNIGGPALHVLGVTQALSPRYSTALVYGDVDAGEGDMSAEVRTRGLRALRIPELGRSVRPWHDAVAFVRLIRYLRAVRPRVVHTHTAKAGTLGRLAALIAGVPVRVHTYHGHVFHGYFGRLGSMLVIAVERMLARITTRVIVIAPSQATDIVERYRICDANRVCVVPLGLELSRFAPAAIAPRRQVFRDEIGAHPNDTVITVVGRLVPIKNHDLFLDAAARLLAQGRDCVFAVVGDGPEQQRLKQRADALGCARAFRFLGWRRDLEAVYAGSDIVALSSNNEGTPVSLIEALAAGRPVVATAVGGVPDVLESGRLGVLVAAGDAHAFAAALARLMDDADERAALAARGPAAVMARYSLERLASNLGNLYDELLGITTRPMRVIPHAQRAMK